MGKLYGQGISPGFSDKAAHAGSAPVLFEVPFGCGQKAVAKAGAGLAGPVEVELDPGSWFLRVLKSDLGRRMLLSRQRLAEVPFAYLAGAGEFGCLYLTWLNRWIVI